MAISDGSMVIVSLLSYWNTHGVSFLHICNRGHEFSHLYKLNGLYARSIAELKLFNLGIIILLPIKKQDNLVFSNAFSPNSLSFGGHCSHLQYKKNSLAHDMLWARSQQS